MEKEENLKYIVRIASTDLNGRRDIATAIRKIKGIGVMYANAILAIANIDSSKKAGALNDAELAKINDIIVNPSKYGIPDWLLNRRKDYENGEDRHLITSNLTFTQDNDVKRLKKIKTYRGMRHAWGLPTRGQRTKSNFRKNKGKVKGVAKKKNK